MKLPRLFFPAGVAGLLILATGCGYVKHVPPGQSLSAAMARKGDIVAVPTPTPAPLAAAGGSADLPQAPLPDTEKVADAFNLGNLCLQQGRYSDAVEAYRTAVKADPTFGEAWSNMALAYQDLGQNEKALEAFRKYKMIAEH